MSAADTLVIGAGSAIGQAFAQLALARGERVTAVSRHSPPISHPELRWVPSNHDESDRARCAAALAELNGRWQRVVICLGLLHEPGLQPERRLEQVDGDALHRLFEVNAVRPMLYLRDLLPLLSGPQPATVAVLSARVGSIGDNRLGGWYGYRAAKAALNMMLQSAAIEYARRAPAVKLVAYHPGTVVSPLSEPFSAGRQRLTPEQSARQLQQWMDSATPDGTLSFIDWAGKPVPW